MKKTLAFLLFSLATISYGQQQDTKKIQFGISYAITNNSIIFNNPFSAYASYRLKKWDKLDISAGFRTFYYNSDRPENFTNKWGFNPNISASHNLKDSKLNIYFSLGYYFDSYVFKPSISGTMQNPNQDVVSNGFTMTPGLKYFLLSNVYIDTNLTLLNAKTKDNLNMTSSSNNTFLNFGLGVAF